MATVELKSIDKLFGEKFFIPAYQRGYRWSTTQVKELLEDLYDFSARKKDQDYYCLQPIIVKRRSDEWELVDGQQRLTALWLISALYYCSNKDDVMGLQHQYYEMRYEGKPIFTKLFKEIANIIEESSFVRLSKNLESHKDECIDSKHLLESVEFITHFTRNNKRSKGVLSDIFDVISKIMIIWYVLDEHEDPIQTFTNVNANKIELTNSELIKAVLLNLSEKSQETNRALQWEELEKGLNDDLFWNFIIHKNRDRYSTRIDYLFEMVCSRDKWIDDYPEDDRYRVYRAVINHLSDENSVAYLWKKIQEAYDVLYDWYQDYFFYHSIGLLVIVSNQSKETELMNQLFAHYTTSTKDEFREYIRSELKSVYISNSKSTPFSALDQIKIGEELGALSFDDRKNVKKILLLYSIALLDIAGNTYERFPFDLYKANTWDIEHINPQTPKEASVEEKKTWLLSYRKIAKEELLIKISECIAANCDGFESIAEEIDQSLGISDKDSMSNLVLLDSGTNRSYKNECFAEKRKVIIETERTNKHGKKYIPIGTKWVFLKEYEKADQLIVWGIDDRAEYIQDIAHKVYSFLGGMNNE